MLKYDPLVYAALALFLIVVGVTAYLLRSTSDHGDLETRKVRFAAVTFTGILTLFVFTAILYFVDEQERGKEIFDTAVKSMTPLAGAIIGYLFGSRQDRKKGANETQDFG